MPEYHEVQAGGIGRCRYDLGGGSGLMVPGRGAEEPDAGFIVKLKKYLAGFRKGVPQLYVLPTRVRYQVQRELRQ